MQDSLPAGGLRLYREGVEPSGSLRKVSGYISILLSRTSPVARAIYANGEPWDLLNGGAVAYHAARIFLTNGAFASEDGAIAARTLGLVIGRHIEGGMHEDIDVTNNSLNSVRFNLEIAVRADFADIFEVKSNRIVRRGRITTSWSEKRQALRFTYRNKDFCREVIVHTAGHGNNPTVNANGRLSFDIALNPGRSWHRCLIYDLVDRPQRIRGPRECANTSETSNHAGKMESWRRQVLKIRSSNEEFYRSYNQGVQDMAALRLPLEGSDHMVFVPAAGLPWFVALFGRDTLVVPSVPTTVRHLPPGSLDLRTRKDHLAHAHAPHTN